MKEKTKELLEKELDAVKHLLDSRGKQIRRLQDDVAGQAEVNRLLAGFLPLLALAAARDGAANEAVRVTGSKDVLSISIEKQALTAVLGEWQLKTVNTDGVYRLAFERLKGARIPGGERLTTEREPAVRDPRLLLRDAGATAVAVIVSLMNDTENKPELRLKAAESILDRACGKAGLSFFDGGEGGGAIRFEGELEAWSR